MLFFRTSRILLSLLSMEGLSLLPYRLEGKVFLYLSKYKHKEGFGFTDYFFLEFESEVK